MKIEEFIQKIAEALYEEENVLTIDTVLDELDGWDSLGRLEIFSLIKEEFEKSIDPESLRNCQKVGDIIDLVEDGLKV
ncbi:acyl carrier protein [Neobacillus sp. NRS-1170]|uniref:acyl carrier protein n=1 Tax=Neobacillus sp. NRS-1170 TaxID=3233898 RepID=UPI003D287D8D